jgi:antitoxin MazE
MTTKIQKWGNSFAIRLPKKVISDFSWSAGTVVDFNQKEDKIIISSCQHKYTLEELVSKITPKNKHKEYDWGKPIGKEIW